MDLINSFKYAARGLLAIFRSERNARIHLSVAVLVVLLSFYFGVNASDLAAILFAILIVFLAEIFNTTIEKTLDIIDTSHNPKVALVKDMAAASVVVASMGALVIGFVIFWPYVMELLWRR